MSDYVEKIPEEAVEYGCDYRTIIETCDNIIAEQMIRNVRGEKLKRSDIYMIPDFPITEEKREEWRIYRQQLRDLPATVTDYNGFRLYELIGTHSDCITTNIDREGFSWPTEPSP
jgi:hypothetical protein